MTTPAHAHAKKKEDIICRWGKLAVKVWASKPPLRENTLFGIPINHEEGTVTSGSIIELEAGSRVTLVPGVYHEFYPVSAECIIGEVSTANDDLHDNFFVDPHEELVGVLMVQTSNGEIQREFEDLVAQSVVD